MIEEWRDIEGFIKNFNDVQEKYKDDEIQAEIERSCYFEEVPAKAIENVLKELKNKNEEIEISDQLIERQYLEIDNLKSELETYKKIAELMADFINMYTLSGEEHHYCHKTMSCAVVGGSRSCIDCIIDWARKEVENEEIQKSN